MEAMDYIILTILSAMIQPNQKGLKNVTKLKVVHLVGFHRHGKR